MLLTSVSNKMIYLYKYSKQLASIDCVFYSIIIFKQHIITIPLTSPFDVTFPVLQPNFHLREKVEVRLAPC